jgi:YD repeat-containing protein
MKRNTAVKHQLVSILARAFLAMCSVLVLSASHANGTIKYWLYNVESPYFNSPSEVLAAGPTLCTADPGRCFQGQNCYAPFACQWVPVKVTGSCQPGQTCLITMTLSRAFNGNPFTTVGTFDYAVASVEDPYEVYASASPLAAAQCGPTCNGVGEPVDPATGATYTIAQDVISSDPTQFARFYSSTDERTTEMSAGWRHAYSQNIKPRYTGAQYRPYLSSPDNSPIYGDDGRACRYGFESIRSRVSTWTNAISSYANGICTLTVAGQTIGTLTLYSASHQPSPSPTLVGFDAARATGQVVSFTLSAGSIVAPPGISLRLSQTAGGYTLVDANDNTERYDSAGRLSSITSRAGLIQTLAYDGAGRLSTITDSFGRGFVLTYDNQGRLGTVTQQ